MKQGEGLNLVTQWRTWELEYQLNEWELPTRHSCPNVCSRAGCPAVTQPAILLAGDLQASLQRQERLIEPDEPWIVGTQLGNVRGGLPQVFEVETGRTWYDIGPIWTHHV